MARQPTTIGPDYFEEMFRGTRDPWDLETSPYEQGKYDESIAALGDRTYANSFEVGCATGILTEKLATKSAALLAIDVSRTALVAASRRLSHLANVACERMNFPAEAPANQFDLVVWSEVAYYWDDTDLFRAADWLSGHLVPDGDLLLVHFTGETDYPQSGDEAVAKLRDTLGEAVVVVEAKRCERYRLDLWRHAA